MATQAFDYTLPISNLLTINRSDGQTPEGIGDLIGVSRWAQSARKLVAVHATNDKPLILEGEPGAGKKFLARSIHRNSCFKEGPFVSLDLREASEHLARTVVLDFLGGGEIDASASGMKPGGTLYVEDVVCDDSALLCDLVMRAAEQGNRCGQGEFQFRIVIGRTIRDENQELQSSGDGVVYETMRIPPLRSRPDDIEPLTTHFINHYCQRAGIEVRAITTETMDALRRYDWPRNISELKTLVNRLVSQTKPPMIDTTVLPAYLLSPSKEPNFLPACGVDLAGEVEGYEVSLIRAALKQCRGRQKAAAHLLRIKPTTLFMKIKRYNIEVGSFKDDVPWKTSGLTLADRGLEEANRPESASEQIHRRY